jgi:hypothetical protein
MQPPQWCHMHHPPSRFRQSWGKLENPSLTCFHAKQAARSQHVPHTVALPSVLLCNRQTIATGFEVKTEKTVATSFEAKPEKTDLVVLRSNHWQTIVLGFEAQPRSTRSSSPCARCRPHMTSPDLPIVQPPSTRPVRPSLVLCTRSPTPATILVAARHTAHVTCNHETSKRDSPNKTKIKVKQPKCPGFEFKPRQVNDSSQTNQGTDHLVSHE